MYWYPVTAVLIVAFGAFVTYRKHHARTSLREMNHLITSTEFELSKAEYKLWDSEGSFDRFTLAGGPLGDRVTLICTRRISCGELIECVAARVEKTGAKLEIEFWNEDLRGWGFKPCWIDPLDWVMTRETPRGDQYMFSRALSRVHHQLSIGGGAVHA